MPSLTESTSATGDATEEQVETSEMATYGRCTASGKCAY